jgi:uncharacterized membrane protein YkvA (DUF1232 family)
MGRAAVIYGKRAGTLPRGSSSPQPARISMLTGILVTMDFGTVLAIVGAVVLVWLVFIAIFWLLRPKDVPLRELVRLVPDVVRLLRKIVADRSVGLDVRVVIVLLMIWIISPIDLIPEFVPVLGPFDDVVVAIVALRYIRRRVGAGQLRERWPGSDEGFELLTRVIGR